MNLTGQGHSDCYGDTQLQGMAVSDTQDGQSNKPTEGDEKPPDTYEIPLLEIYRFFTNKWRGFKCEAHHPSV